MPPPQPPSQSRQQAPIRDPRDQQSRDHYREQPSQSRPPQGQDPRAGSRPSSSRSQNPPPFDNYGQQISRAPQQQAYDPYAPSYSRPSTGGSQSGPRPPFQQQPVQQSYGNGSLQPPTNYGSSRPPDSNAHLRPLDSRSSSSSTTSGASGESGKVKKGLFGRSKK